MAHGVNPVKLHAEYYLRDGSVCFLVQETMFRLHRHFFERESEYFRKRLKPSTEDEDGSPGSPYHIEGVTIDEFAQFVWVWYNPQYSFSRKGKEHWLVVLKLATMWQFPEIRNLAIRQLERLSLPPVEKIALYKEYDINADLLMPSYMTLCRNEKLPSPEEGKRLSLDTVLKLASARERILTTAKESGCKTPTTASAPDDVAKAIIADLFGLASPSGDPSVGGRGAQASNNGIASGNTSVDNDITKLKKGPKAEPNGTAQPNGTVGLSGGKGKNKQSL